MSQSKLITYIVRSMISITTITCLIAVPIGKKSEVNKKKESLDEINNKQYNQLSSKESVSIKTGKSLAIFEFEARGISTPIAKRMTEQFRNTVRKLNMFEVQDRGLTQRVNIFRPETNDYWDCWNKDCALERGRLLNVNYVIAGTIQDTSDNQILIKGRLYSVDLESLMSDFSLNSTDVTDSLLLGMKKLAYDVSGLPIPDTLSAGSDTAAVVDYIIEKEKFKFRFPDLDIPEKIKSLLLSTVVPGTGQMYSKRKYIGMGFLATELTLGGFALLWHSDYKQSWGGFENTYTNYQNYSDPKMLLELRPDIVRYAEETKRYNDLMRNVRNLGLGIWVINMIHAYIVGPEEIYEGSFLFGSAFENEDGMSTISNITAWDLASDFGLKGILLRPFTKNQVLKKYRNHTSGGLRLKTPLGITLGPIKTDLQYEITNYTFDLENYDNENVISAFNRATIINIDYSNIFKIGGENLQKNILFGFTKSKHGPGFMTGMDIAFKIDASVPLSLSIFARTNSLNSTVHGSMLWMTAGVDLGVEIP